MVSAINGKVIMSGCGGRIPQPVARGDLTVAEAAMAVGVGERQYYRIKVRAGIQGSSSDRQASRTVDARDHL